MDVDRRAVLQAGGLVVVGGVAVACGSSPPGGASPAPSSPAASAAPAAPSASAAAAGAQGIARVSDVPVGGGLIIDDPAVVITQPTAGEVKAFTAICTHQGCLVSSVEGNQIICPCHGSRFSATDGSVVQGPATLPLQPAGIAVEGGSVVLA
ncbi:MAG: Rieske (2Fe-2S) protein [Candidatus Nanopelagicales bacterium]